MTHIVWKTHDYLKFTEHMCPQVVKYLDELWDLKVNYIQIVFIGWHKCRLDGHMIPCHRSQAPESNRIFIQKLLTAPLNESGGSYLQEELDAVSQTVREDRSVEGLDSFLIEPALTACMILWVFLKVWPTRHLRRWDGQGTVGELKDGRRPDVSSEAVTYGSDVAADHQTHVLGERMNQVKQSRTSVWKSSQHQTLWPANTQRY